MCNDSRIQDTHVEGGYSISIGSKSHIQQEVLASLCDTVYILQTNIVSTFSPKAAQFLLVKLIVGGVARARRCCKVELKWRWNDLEQRAHSTQHMGTQRVRWLVPCEAVSTLSQPLKLYALPCSAFATLINKDPVILLYWQCKLCIKCAGSSVTLAA